MTFFRVKSVWMAGLPGRPKFEVVIAFGPLKAEPRSVQIHQQYLNQIEPQHEHRVQKIVYEG